MSRISHDFSADGIQSSKNTAHFRLLRSCSVVFCHLVISCARWWILWWFQIGHVICWLYPLFVWGILELSKTRDILFCTIIWDMYYLHSKGIYLFPLCVCTVLNWSKLTATEWAKIISNQYKNVRWQTIIFQNNIDKKINIHIWVKPTLNKCKNNNESLIIAVYFKWF